MEKNGQRVLENMVLRKILGFEGDEVTGERRRLYSSPRILPSGGLARTVASLKALIPCHVFSAAGRPDTGHPVANVRQVLELPATGNQ